jgi:hypothetical protein
MLRTLVLLVGALVSISTVPSNGQEVLAQLYGNGVHAYFAGDFVQAHDQLDAAVAGGSRDPRVYYYRGLAFLRLGREPEALQDFQAGAELESKDLNRTYNVARSLERIQGSIRQRLETYRVDARLAAMEEGNRVRKARFESIQREEGRVLRSPADQGKGKSVLNPSGQPKGDDSGVPAEPKKVTPETKDANQPKSDVPGDFGSGDAEKPEPEMNAEKPAKETIKHSILDAMLKSGSSGVKSVGEKAGELGKNLSGGKGGPGKAPGMMPPAGGSDEFGSGDSDKPAPPEKKDSKEKKSPFKDEPAGEAPAGADPFGT